MSKLTRTEETWEVTIDWGRDVTGNDSDRADTVAIIRQEGAPPSESLTLLSEDALLLADFIIEQLRGDPE